MKHQLGVSFGVADVAPPLLENAGAMAELLKALAQEESREDLSDEFVGEVAAYIDEETVSFLERFARRISSDWEAMRDDDSREGA